MNSWAVSIGSAVLAKPTRLLAVFALGAGLGAAAQAETVEIQSEIAGTTPAVLGYNLGYFREGSNAEDWLRYSGVKAMRIFMSPSSIEPEDDIPGVGDGVNSEQSFKDQRDALRKNAGNPAVALKSRYVKWKKFENGIKAMGKSYTGGYTLSTLHKIGVDIHADLTAYKGTFPLESNTEYANMWELWQHYYAAAFIMGRDYDVHSYGIYNEPDLTNTVTPTNWQLRLRVTSDAIHAALEDVNSRYGKHLVANILAPNTSNPSYADGPGSYKWGQTAVLGRHTDMWGKTSPDYLSFNYFNYQKYTHRQYESDGYNGYIEDCRALKTAMAADMPGETPFPLTLTEWNTRTGGGYDDLPNNADTPLDYTALGASAVALSGICEAAQLYLFKFAMGAATESKPKWPVQKNGTHHADISEGGLNNYGTAAGTAEVWRLFVKASGQSRNRYTVVNPFSGAVAENFWVQATRDPVEQITYLFVANKNATDVQAGFNLSALGIANGSLVTVAEVSATARGAIKRVTQLNGGLIAPTTMSGYSVWLIAVHEGATAAPAQVATSDDAALSDGLGKTSPGANATRLVARADGTLDGRKVGLLKFNLPVDVASKKRILLALNTAQTASSSLPTHSHVYGLEFDSWTSATATWESLATVLKQDAGTESKIINNVVLKPGRTSKIQGQLIATSTTPALKYIDVTDFVKAQTNGKASFLLVQDHRWDYNLDTRASGDKQTAGIAVDARSGGIPPVLLMY